MTRLKYVSLFTHTYLTDMFLLCFIVVFLNVHNGREALIFTFTVIVILMMALSFIIVRHFKLGRIYFMLPVVLIVSLLLDFHFLAAVLMSYLPVLRLEYLHDDVEDQSAPVTLIITFLLLLGVNVLTTEATLAYSTIFHMIFIGLVIFYFVGKIPVLLINNGYPLSKNVFIFFTASGIFLSIGIMLGSVYHYIVYALKYAVMLALNGFIFLLRPFFSALENIEFEPPEMPGDDEIESDEGERLEDSLEGSSAVSAIPVETIMTGIFTIAVIAALYIYYKKREKPELQGEKHAGRSKASVYQTERNFSDKDINPPEGRVRRVYYEFERWLASIGLGRYKNETINEWIERLELEKVIDSERLEIYLQTRYSDAHVSNENFIKYRKNIQLMKADIKKHFNNQKRS